MFRFKSKNNDKIKIDDLNIEVFNKWTYLSDEQFLNSKDIKKYLDQLIVETDNDQYKIKKDNKISIKEENKMFVVNPPQDKKIIDTNETKKELKGVEDIKNKTQESEDNLLKELDEEIKENPVNEELIQEQINKITETQEENSGLIKKLTANKAKDNNEIKKEDENMIKNEGKEINNNEKDINKIEKTSKRGRPHKKEVTKKEDNK